MKTPLINAPPSTAPVLSTQVQGSPGSASPAWRLTTWAGGESGTDTALPVACPVADLDTLRAAIMESTPHLYSGSSKYRYSGLTRPFVPGPHMCTDRLLWQGYLNRELPSYFLRFLVQSGSVSAIGWIVSH